MANASIEMAVYCFDVIYSVVNRAKEPKLPLSIPNIKKKICLQSLEEVTTRQKNRVVKLQIENLQLDKLQIEILQLVKLEINMPQFVNCCYWLGALAPHSSIDNGFTLDELRPLFVTWKIGADHDLRGCIGTFADLRLDRGLNEYAKISAFQDTRFKPIVKEEIQHLQCGVSLLVNFEDIANYLDWQVGVHGIRMNFTDKGRHRSSVYLPEVASQEGWDHITTIDNLIRKAGYRDHIDENLRKSLKLVRFQSSKVVLDYQDYANFKRMRGLRVPH